MSQMFNPPHPGGLLKECLEELGVSEKEFALRIGVSPSTVNRFIKGKSSLSPILAAKIATAIGGSPRIWLSMQVDYDSWKTQKETDLSFIIPYQKHLSLV